MIVQLIKIISKTDEYEIENLTVGQKYEVIEITDGFYRIISEDDNEPYLYPADCFIIIDNEKPAFWVIEIGDDGEKYYSPPNWNKVGFWEDYFDGVEKVKKQFQKEYRKYYKPKSHS